MTDINLNYSEYKSKIEENLDLFFKEDKFINNIIDNDIISTYNLHITNNNNFKEFIINIAKDYILKQFCKDYKIIANFNNDFIINYLELKINDNSTLQISNNYVAYFKQFIDNVLNNRYNINETIKYHTYLIYSLQKEIKELNESINNSLINLESDIIKETEEQTEEINKNLIKFNEDLKKKELHEIITLHNNNEIKNLKMILMFNIMFQLLFITFYYWSM